METEPKPPAAAPGRFEDSLKRLEEVVAGLERADLGLEESVKLFEEGMALVAECRQQLDAAEGKVEMLVRRAGSLTPEPFTPEKGSGGPEDH